jgi:2-polyprenyl-3-methyl-5-hydroxy-6-metoxy-1,4-benzoquinol methylase
MIDSRLVRLKNRMIVALDPELRQVRDLINAEEIDGTFGRSDADAIFRNRLEVFAKALKLSFWEDHFEWKSVKDYPEISGTVLDFGCGSGHLDVMLARHGYRVHGVDVSGLAIRIAEHLKSKETEEVRARLTFQAADITREVPSGRPFDSAWSAHVFEHIEDPGPVLQGLAKWLKPGASLLISVPLGRAYDDPGHVHHFNDGVELRSHLSRYVGISRIDVSREHQVIRAVCTFP